MQTTLWGSLDPTRVNHDYSQISSPLPHRLEISGVGGNTRWRAAGRDMSVTMADLPPLRAFRGRAARLAARVRGLWAPRAARHSPSGSSHPSIQGSRSAGMTGV